MSRVVGERLRNHRSLVVVCTAAAVVEAILVSAFAPTSSLGLATQVSAPPPFGVFHDLRWIVVYHQSWIGLAGELLAFLVIRSLLTARVPARGVAARLGARAMVRHRAAQRAVHGDRRGLARAVGGV